MLSVPVVSANGELFFAILLALLALTVSLRSWRYITAQRRMQRGLVERINSLLPQTQCGRCSHEGCLPYAKAIANGEAINKCPPGGQSTINKLGRLLHEYETGLDPAHGDFTPPQVAVIREAECIGCTKCIRACPVDAIIGGPKLMHTVIEDECTGCDLCLEPCPVDCIDLVPVSKAIPALEATGAAQC